MFRRDDSFAEHKCCYDAAIVTDCVMGKGLYGGDIELVCECREEYVDLLIYLLNKHSQAVDWHGGE